MKQRVQFLRLLLVVLATTGAPGSLSASYVAFDTFDSYATGAIAGKGPAGNTWTGLTGTSIVNSGGGDNVAELAAVTTGGANYRSLTPAGLSIADSSTASTVYFNFTLSAVGTVLDATNNWNFIITDVAAPADIHCRRHQRRLGEFAQECPEQVHYFGEKCSAGWEAKGLRENAPRCLWRNREEEIARVGDFHAPFYDG